MAHPIKGFNPHTLIDWEGKVACVMYLAGCNFRCPFCHSSDLVTAPQALATIPFERIERFLQEKQGWIDGVVIGGGEPTLYEQLPILLEDIRKLGLLIKIDTNGTVPEMLREILRRNLVDFVAMDIKAPLEEEKYCQVVESKVAIEDIRESINLLMNSVVEHEFRTTVVPVLLSARDIMKIARSLHGAQTYVLQQFSPKDTLDKNLAVLAPYPSDELKKSAQLAKEFVKNCFVRGI